MACGLSTDCLTVSSSVKLYTTKEQRYNSVTVIVTSCVSVIDSLAVIVTPAK